MNNNLQVTAASHNGVDVLKNNSDNKFVLYYAPWCGHCKHFLPKWEDICEQVSEKHPNLNVKLVRVDCEYIQGKEKETLGFNPNVMGYPTLRVYKKHSNNVEEYHGSREVDDIVEFLNSHFSEETPVKPKKKSSKKKGSKKESNKDKKKKKGSKRKGSKKRKSKSQQ